MNLNTWKKQAVAIVLAALLVVSTFSISCQSAALTPSPPEQLLTVHFIDVGQGDAILIDYGQTEVLIDGGDGNPSAAGYISPFVDGNLEVLVATHPHADHIGGLIAVLQQYGVQDIYLNGETGTSQTYTNFMNAVNSENAVVHYAKQNESIQVGTLIFNVLNPPNPLFSDSDKVNNNSIVLLLRYGDIDFLFMGDAENTAESNMLAFVPDVDVLKVGHHGSRYSSSESFLNQAKPEVAIYMANKNDSNEYNHPHTEAINRLQSVGAQIYGTDIDGTIKVITDGRTFSTVTTNSVPEGMTSINLIKENPAAYDGITVTLWGSYRGWETGHGTPPVSRSDWVIQDASGSIYVTGSNMGLFYPNDVGKLVKVVGIIGLKNGQPYIEVGR